jgi:glutathione S-transferase
MLSLLNIDANIVTVDLMSGAHKKPEFLSLNPHGAVPVLQDGDFTQMESTAILTYLATKYDSLRQWLPESPEAQAKVHRYLALAAGPIAAGPARARLITVFGASYDAEATIALAHRELAILNAELEGKNWLVGDHATIADVALYAYIAHAPEGNVSLEDYPNIRRWLSQVEFLPNFVPMQATKVGLAA